MEHENADHFVFNEVNPQVLIWGREDQVLPTDATPSMYGGTCINIGCIPTKSLVHNAKIALAHTDWDFAKRADFYRKAIEEKRELVGALNRKNYHMLADNEKIDVITGEASFISPTEIEVRLPGNGTVSLSAEKIFVNTGAREIVPNIRGAQNKGVFTSTSLLDSGDLPRSLCIVGGGYIGLEFASAYASFGSKVTVLEYGDRLLKREDRDIATAVRERLEGLGVEFVLNADTEEILSSDGGNILLYRDSKSGKSNRMQTDAILFAIWRKPDTDGLNLGAAGVELTESGGIRTDGYLRSSQENIWAMGDVVGNEQFTYVSLDDSRIVKDQLWGNKVRSTGDRKPIPYAVFTEPPLSRVGMSEQEAESA